MPENSPSIAVGDINPKTIYMLLEGKEYYSVNLDEKWGGVSYEALQEQMRGYHASISFLDFQLGRLLDALEKVSEFCVCHVLAYIAQWIDNIIETALS